MPVQAEGLHAETQRLLDPTIAVDLQGVEKLLTDGVRSVNFLPRELAQRLVLSGGKRIRPYLMCLTYRCLRNSQPALKARADEADLHHLAAVAEWVHTATLFHDDVLDASPARRNQPAAHITHGNKVAILVGDFVYAEAFSILMDRGLLHPSQRLASTIKSVVEGELLQHKVATERSLKLEEFDQIARAKTGDLFGWCTETGAWVAGSKHFEAARDFGQSLGYAFQMADDLFDTYSLDPLMSDDTEIVQWTESAPPLPIVLAAEGNPSLHHAWSDLGMRPDLRTRRQKILKIQEVCRDERIVSSCLKRVEKVLDEARGKLELLGATDGLEWSLKVIWQRALEGAALARVPAPNSEDLSAKISETF